MKEIIIIAGAPGSGKSTIANELQHKLNSPLFEFGWIPEFRNTGNKIITYSDDESIAFENLVLVVKNYIKHDYKNIIITDLENYHIKNLSNDLKDCDYIIFTLRQSDEALLRARVLDETRSSGFRNWKEANKVNNNILKRKPFQNEIFIDVDKRSVEEITQQILSYLS